MAWSLTEDAFALLLDKLDDDRERAGEKYEDLRRMLLRFFEWRGATFCEERADETLNRLARRLSDGVSVQEMRAYAMQIARLVLLESYKSRDARRASWDEITTEPMIDERVERAHRETAEINQHCLQHCLRQLPEESRQLILAYYQYTGRDQIERRAALAHQLGLRREALANRAQRLRDKLADCVTRCVNRKRAI
jgi:DNA-directed RNA polymerase specialized sigma24 family protein